MLKFIKKTTFILTGLLLPIVSFASDTAPAATNGGKTALQLLKEVTGVINSLVPIVIGLGILVFLWGILRYVLSKSDGGKGEGRTFMLWGIIALFVMVSIWGLVNILQSSFLGNVDSSTPPQEEIESLKKKPDIESTNIPGEGPIMELLKRVAQIIEAAIPLIMLLGVLFVLWGIFQYAFSNDSKSKETARTIIIWGVIGLTVMAFVWSFVVILQRTVFQDIDPTALGESGRAVGDLQKDPKIEGGNITGPRNVGQGINVPIGKVTGLVQDAIPLLISLGILLFLWGVFKYVSSSSAKIKSEGVALMSWGVVVLCVMGSVWYFVNLIAETSDISLEQQPNIGKEGVSPSELIIK